jgi:hypothetical protein
MPQGSEPSPLPPTPLAPAETARLTELARALKAAARAVTLYPQGHPAIGVTLGRIAQLTSAGNLAAPLRITVLADALQVEGQAPARPDAAIAELAALLHAQLIGELAVNPGGSVDDWRNFLLLVGRPPEEVRAEGGIARLWTTMAGRHVQIREIDYAEVLRERESGRAAAWDQVIANCLQGDAFELDEETVVALLEAAMDPGKLRELLLELDAKAAESGRGTVARAAAIIRLMEGIIGVVEKREPEKLDTALHTLAQAVSHMSPEVMLSLLRARSEAAGDLAGSAALIDGVISRMSDESMAGFVARNATAEGSSLDRVAHAFSALVPDGGRRERLLALAHDEAAHSPLGHEEGFEQMWDQVAQKLLTSYSDKPFVSEDYGRELSAARSQAITVEQVNDDPSERIAAWLSTVATSELRKLELMLVQDLLRIEEDTERWATLMRPAVALVEDLFLVGDFESAEPLLAAIVGQTGGDAPQQRRQTALIAIDVLASGSMMRHLAPHLATIDDGQFERVKRMLLSMGEVMIRPVAEALSKEERTRPRERMTAVLLAYGAIGRREAERLKASPNAAVRRTAIYLLREFGGSDALPDLTELLDDQEQGVQREAVRAILNIGTDRAYEVLEKALISGTPRSRETIMQSISILRDERAAPLFVYILRHVDHRGALGWIYAKAIESLGALKDPDGVPALKEALYRGEWWAPRRTAAFRASAAAALARIGTADALAVLEEASASGLRGVRTAARAHLGAGVETQVTPMRTR